MATRSPSKPTKYVERPYHWIVAKAPPIRANTRNEKSTTRQVTRRARGAEGGAAVGGRDGGGIALGAGGLVGQRRRRRLGPPAVLDHVHHHDRDVVAASGLDGHSDELVGGLGRIVEAAQHGDDLGLGYLVEQPV